MKRTAQTLLAAIFAVLLFVAPAYAANNVAVLSDADTTTPTVESAAAPASNPDSSQKATNGTSDNSSSSIGNFVKHFIGMLLGYFLLLPIVIIVIIVASSRSSKKHKVDYFQQTPYFIETGNSYLATMNDAGKKGEYALGDQLARAFPSVWFAFNVYVPKGNGYYSEVDVVMITAKGIYVFETKNYSGWIFGRATDEKWTQTFRTGTKSRFYNPIKQNAAHIKALAEYLHLDRSCFVSIVVFGNQCTLKSISSTVDVPVVYCSDASKTVASIEAQRADMFSRPQMDVIHNRMKAVSNVDESVKAAHISNSTAMR